MSKNSRTDAEDILSELENTPTEESPVEPKVAEESPVEPKVAEESPVEPKVAEESPVEPKVAEESPVEPKVAEESKTEGVGKPKQSMYQKPETRNTIPVGKKPIMTYVNSTLTQLSSLPVVTVTARGKSITTAVDVSQFILKRMDFVGYKIDDVRISSNLLESNDGKKRNVSSIEIDIMRIDS